MGDAIMRFPWSGVDKRRDAKRGESTRAHDYRRSVTFCALAVRRVLVKYVRRVSDTSILRLATKCFLTTFRMSFFRRLELARALRLIGCAGGKKSGDFGRHCRL